MTVQIFLANISLLFFTIVGATVGTAKAQILTLDQLIQLRKYDAVDVDDYLAKRDWKYFKDQPTSDSLLQAVWVFDGTHKERKAELILSTKIGSQTLIAYGTSSRTVFNTFKAKVAQYKMDKEGVSYDEGNIWSIYLGATYRVALKVCKPTSSHPVWFIVSVQPHGLTKSYTKQNDGSLKAEWINIDWNNSGAYFTKNNLRTILYERADTASNALTNIHSTRMVVVDNECDDCGQEFLKITCDKEPLELEDEIDPKTGGIGFKHFTGYVLKSSIIFKTGSGKVSELK